jgi:hypothetical protein
VILLSSVSSVLGGIPKVLTLNTVCSAIGDIPSIGNIDESLPWEYYAHFEALHDPLPPEVKITRMLCPSSSGYHLMTS